MGASFKTKFSTRQRKKIQPKSKAWYQKKYSLQQLATNAMNGVLYLKKLVNAEKKYFDLNATTNVDFNGVLVHLTPIPEGSGAGQRNGIKIAARSLYIRTNVLNSSAISSGFMRIIIFFDKFNTGTAPTISDLVSTAGSTHATVTPTSYKARTRYEILYDKVLTSSGSSHAANARKIYIKLFRKINYTASLGSDEYSNQLYMVALSNTNGNNPQLIYSSRFGYMDN